MKRILWTSLGLFGLVAILASPFGLAWSVAPANGDEADEIEAVAAFEDMAPAMPMHGGRHGRAMMRGGMMGMRGGWGLGAIERLDLTADQREKLAGIRDRQQRAGIESRAELETAGLDLRKLMRAESPSVTQINAQIDRMAKMRAEIQKSRVGAMIEARNLLTSDQRAKLREGRSGPAHPSDDSN